MGIAKDNVLKEIKQLLILQFQIFLHLLPEINRLLKASTLSHREQAILCRLSSADAYQRRR